MWQSVPHDTEYFQFKVDNVSSELGSFNYTDSTTTWTNLTNITIQNKTAVGYLNYSDKSDEVEIDIRVKVPLNEPPGVRRSVVYIIGEVA